MFITFTSFSKIQLILCLIMFSLLVIVSKILVTSLISLFKYKLFRKMIVSIDLLFSALWEHLFKTSFSEIQILTHTLSDILTGLLVYHACYTAEARRCELLNMHFKRVETAASV